MNWYVLDMSVHFSFLLGAFMETMFSTIKKIGMFVFLFCFHVIAQPADAESLQSQVVTNELIAHSLSIGCLIEDLARVSARLFCVANHMGALDKVYDKTTIKKFAGTSMPLGHTTVETQLKGHSGFLQTLIQAMYQAEKEINFLERNNNCFDAPIMPERVGSFWRKRAAWETELSQPAAIQSELRRQEEMIKAIIADLAATNKRIRILSLLNKQRFTPQRVYLR